MVEAVSVCLLVGGDEEVSDRVPEGRRRPLSTYYLIPHLCNTCPARGGGGGGGG